MDHRSDLLYRRRQGVDVREVTNESEAVAKFI
jgi:hypothetical protein